MSRARTYHRFSLADYDQMIDHGILVENDRVELIRGEIIEKISIGEWHAACVRRLTRIFSVRLADRAAVSVQNPVRLSDSEPEPDISLLKPRTDDYVSYHPTAADALLVIEVADATLEIDRTVKRELYAENGIAEYWIVNLCDRTVEVHREPQSTGMYAEIRVYSADDQIEPQLLPNARFTVSELLPPMP
ncbi:MAG: Uma2 family endonuclease [Pirellulales bacterium]|nr:Uma2 family endonuclease [Pirellulales bacterium]